ncbi:MAG: beta-propeller fold lactonase family protein [Paracoccaceae bacterium]
MWALVGSYSSDDTPGGLTAFRFDAEAGTLEHVGRADRDLEAGYLVFDPATATLYAVDERKTDGRGPVGPAAAVHAFGFNASTGALAWRNSHVAPGPFPTFLDYDAGRNLLVSASHGSFDHVERVVQDAAGNWTVEYIYDASTVALYRLANAGGIAGLADVVVLDGHGLDPNASPQAGGHAQSTAHAQCATLDPSGTWLVVCDKGTDTILTYRMGDRLERASRYQFPPETAPRHVAFTADSTRMFVTLELASGLASMGFDPETGELTLIDRVSATDGDCGRVNEPAELRLHPNERFVYLNNRGEDSLAWFSVAPDGTLTREGHVCVAASIHPGLAARNFMFATSGRFLLFADRPADCIRIYAVDPETGTPTEVGQAPVSQPAYVAIVEDKE